MRCLLFLDAINKRGLAKQASVFIFSRLCLIEIAPKRALKFISERRNRKKQCRDLWKQNKQSERNAGIFIKREKIILLTHEAAGIFSFFRPLEDDEVNQHYNDETDKE